MNIISATYSRSGKIPQNIIFNVMTKKALYTSYINPTGKRQARTIKVSPVMKVTLIEIIAHGNSKLGLNNELTNLRKSILAKY